MKPVGLIHDPRFAEHRTAHGHPERPQRLSAVNRGIELAQLERTIGIPPRPATDAELLRVHDAAYIARLQKACAFDHDWIDCVDSSICPASERIARLAAGGVIDAAAALAAGRLQRAFCAVRPPGHHAERERSMGFCLYNSIAIAARALQDEYGAERILILDWDVHHGNGTQHTFEEDPGVLFVSLHGHPAALYPGTGYESERGHGAGAGYTLNVAMMPGAGDAEYRLAFDERIEPLIDQFRPEFVLISAGFDAHQDDPLGVTALTDDAYTWMTRRLCAWADQWAEGRVLSVLEGGYDLGVLQRCVAAHLRALA